ncbi:MAG: hypothetical protein KJO76_05405 [Gammaproteobacteria bacterium]|nr:hypothetical protein [Gammaproteobacteria bacterium]NND37883.1 hypothetical protein [Gammaproteobacteria bacterium]
MKHWICLSIALGLLVGFPAAAQKAGQNATVTLGVVQSAERVTLQSTGGGKGAVVSGQTQIQIGDCVTVEQSGDLANIRRQDPLACERPEVAASTDVQAEFVDDADKCAAARREILDATTKDDLELATAKANILCE